MKKIHILSIALLLVGAYILQTSFSKDISTYATYEDAQKGNRVKIAGVLARDREMIYDPANDAERFIFHMTDEKGVTKKVILNQAKPQEFERSETVVVTGSMKDDTFYATDILVKCPSKYKGEESELMKGMEVNG